MVCDYLYMVCDMFTMSQKPWSKPVCYKEAPKITAQ